MDSLVGVAPTAPQAPQWVRRGECNKCGWCCNFPFDAVALFFPNGDPRREEFLKVRGFEPAKDGGQNGLMAWGRVFMRCQHHQDDNGCGIFDKPERPQMCHDFPEKPSQVSHTPCSYWFEDEAGVEQPVGGNASPYPVP